MALKAILESLDGVSDDIKKEYTEKDGKFYLDVEDDIKTHPKIVPLQNAYERQKTTLQTTKTELEAAKARLEGLPDDFDASAYEDLKAKAEHNGDADVDEQVAAARQQGEAKLAAEKQKWEAKQAAELKKRDDKIAQQDAVIQEKFINGDLSAAMDEAKIDPEHKQMLAPYLKQIGKLKLVDEDGTLTVQAETEFGPAPLTKFVTDWAASEKGKNYVVKPTGLDSDGDKPKGSTDVNPFSARDWNKTAQARLHRDDIAKADRMAKAAGFTDSAAGCRAREAIQKKAA